MKIRGGHVVTAIAIVVVYFLAAEWGLTLAYINPSVTAVWPPTGFAIGALIWGGPRLWPAIFFAAFVANWGLTDTGFVTSLSIAAGNLFEALVGAVLCRRFLSNQKSVNDSPADFQKFFFFGAMLAPLTSATWGTLSLYFGGHAAVSTLGQVWLTWWVGDSVGALIFTPLLLNILDFRRAEWSIRKILEFSGLSLLLCVVGGGIFLGSFGKLVPDHLLRPDWEIPLLVCIAVRFSALGVSFALLANSFFAIQGASRSLGVFATGTPGENLLQLQLYMAIVVVTIQLLFAAFSERRRVHASLQKEMEERKRAEMQLRLAADRLQRTNYHLESFAHAVSHDLKAPLRTIASYIALLAERHRDLMDENSKQFIQFVLDGAERMNRLIDDLLTFSRAGYIESPDNCNLNTVIEKVLDDLKPSLEAAKGQVELDELPLVKANASQMALVFQNLIGNALKFRSPAVAPRITITADKDTERVTVCVRDNGIGIDSQYTQRIFKVFQRLHSEQEFPGSGIGLSTCQRIIENLGGKIWVESHVGKGSTFFFTIPNQPAV